MDELIERLEKLAIVDGVPVTKEADRDIARLIGWHRVEPRFTRNKHGGWIAPEDFICVESDGSPRLDSLHGTTIHRDVPNFTASIDAALTLTEGMDEAQIWAIWNEALTACSCADAHLVKDLPRFLCIASLKAIKDKEG